MFKSLLLILIFVLTFPFLSHAASGDITIGTRTYTQAEAQKKIVTPLLQRIDKQKVSKTKLRLLTLNVRLYTNKQKSAQKQGKIELAKFYESVISALKGRESQVSLIGTGSSSSGTTKNQDAPILTRNGSGELVTRYSDGRIKINMNDGSTKIVKPDGTVSITSGGQSNDGMFLTSGTQDEVLKAQIRGDVYGSYDGGLGTNQSKARFVDFIAQQYGTNTYAVEYANTLTFNKP